MCHSDCIRACIVIECLSGELSVQTTSRARPLRPCSQATEKIITSWLPFDDECDPIDGAMCIAARSHSPARSAFAEAVASYSNGPFVDPKVDQSVGWLSHSIANVAEKLHLTARQSESHARARAAAFSSDSFHVFQEPKWLSTHFRAGDVVFLHVRTIHCTLPNRSRTGKVRTSCDSRFQATNEPAICALRQ